MAATVLVLLTALVAGCGSDSGSPSSTAASRRDAGSRPTTAAPDTGPSTTPTSNPPASVATVTGQPLADPPVLAGANGRMTATLTVAASTVTIAGVSVKAQTYNGSFMPPTLVMQPGDRVEITVENRLGEGNNLHVHGMHVSPLPPGDDVLISIDPGQSYTYVYDLPKDMAPGTYWYHSHEHHLSEGQVFAGLSGLIEVGGLTALLPEPLRGVTQHTFALKDFQIDATGAIPTHDIDSNASTTRTVNGQVQPVVSMAPGETQLWRLANISADIFYRVSLGDVSFHVIAEDANPVQKVWGANELVLPPGKRYDVLVQAPATGSLTLSTLSYDQGGDNYPTVPLATVSLAGTPGTPAALPTSLAPMEDLRGVPVAAERTFQFSESANGNQFFINGQQFDPNVVNTTVKLGTTEQWTLSNTSTEQHPFHIHVDDFQVISVNGQPYDAQSWQDTVILPPGGQVVIRIAFRDFVGKFVYHCHILAHEDHGMMGIVEVTN